MEDNNNLLEIVEAMEAIRKDHPEIDVYSLLNNRPGTLGWEVRQMIGEKKNIFLNTNLHDTTNKTVEFPNDENLLMDDSKENLDEWINHKIR